MECIEVQIPKEIANQTLPDPELRNFYLDLEDRTFWLDNEVTPYLLELVRYIARWNKEDIKVPIKERKPIRIFIFSPGGDLETYRSIADVIQLSKTPVIGINMGVAYSAAAMIFLSCHTRLMLPSASVLFHKGSGNLGGSFNEVYAAMIEYQKQVEELSNIIEKNTTYSLEEIEENMNGDWYIRADEALEYGVCHKIIDDIEEIM
jgi:ATP-dependent Clp protease protease subunit